MIHEVSGAEVRILFLWGKIWSDNKKRERKILVEKSQIMEEIQIKLNNVRFILRLFQNIQIRNRQLRNVEFSTNIFTSLDREDCKRETD